MSAEITPDLVSEMARRLFQRDIYPLGAALSEAGTIPAGPVGPSSVSASELPGSDNLRRGQRARISGRLFPSVQQVCPRGFRP